MSSFLHSYSVQFFFVEDWDFVLVIFEVTCYSGLEACLSLSGSLYLGYHLPCVIVRLYSNQLFNITSQRDSVINIGINYVKFSINISFFLVVDLISL